MNAERAARMLVVAVGLGVPLAVLLPRWPGLNSASSRTIEIHARMADDGGWIPRELTAVVGEPLQLHLASDDVMHGFAVGHMDLAPVDVKPGEVTRMTITFHRPGKYVFYCTRWCGLNHWRMRGTIEVGGTAATADDEPTEPLYMSLGLDLDAPHSAEVIPERAPSATHAATLGASLPHRYLTQGYYRTHSPSETWRSLRAEPVTLRLTDMEVWDLAASVWQSNTSRQIVELGNRLYATNCAACHGEAGAGDGVMAAVLASDAPTEFGHGLRSPADFTERERMLGANPALLQGKVIRGGMGTGMPNWGPILTDSQTWAVVDFLWTFQFVERDSAMRQPTQ